jgi:predicted metalloprotease
MRMDDQRESDNLEDRRGSGMGGGGGFLGGGRLGLGTIAIALVASYFLGINPLTVLSMLSGGGGMPAVEQSAPPRPTSRRPTTKPPVSFPRSWRRPKIPGTRSSAPTAASTRSPSWSCSAA